MKSQVPLRAAVAASVVAAGLLIMPTTPANAAAASKATVRETDTKQFPVVRISVLVDGELQPSGAFHVRENGKKIPDSGIQVRQLSETGRAVGTVLVIDSSGSMLSRGAMDQAKAAAKQFVAARKPNESIAIVSFAGQAQVATDFTQDIGSLNTVIDQLAAEGETALWDGLATGARLLSKSPQLQPNIVLISDGGDTVSSLDQTGALAAISSARATVLAVGLQTNEFNPSILRSVVGPSGVLLTNTNPATLTSELQRLRGVIDNQYEVIYTSSASPGALAIEVSVGSAVVNLTTRAGSSGDGSQPSVRKQGSSLVDGILGKIFILLFVFLAVGSVVGALLFLFMRDQERVGRRLEMYGVEALPLRRSQHEHSLVESELLQRGVEVAEQALKASPILKKTEDLLDRANLSLRAGEALVVYALGAIVFGMLAVALAPSRFMGLLIAGVIAVIPWAAVNYRVSRTAAAFEEMLPDTLQLLAGSLRAGYSLMQGVEALAEQVGDPMQREIRRVLAEARLGRTIEDGLADVAVRMKSKDFAWSVTAIRIQREVGGNLAEVLNTVAETMVERDRLRREVKSLTAEGRISAIVMGALPLVMGVLLMSISPGYLNPLFETSTGKLMVGGSLGLGAFGFLWLQRLVKLDF